MGLAEEVSLDIDVWRARCPWAARELGWEGGWRATMRSPQQVGGLGGRGRRCVRSLGNSLEQSSEDSMRGGEAQWVSGGGAVSAQIDEPLARPHAVSQGSL